MRARDADRLQNGDEVTLVEDGSTATVLRAYRYADFIVVEVMSESRGYLELSHKDVK